MRKCSRVGCETAAVATMTYGYSDATAVIGPLSPKPTQGALDLCAMHAESVTVPRGWQMVRLRTEFEPAPPSESDLMALADAIRETSHRSAPAPEQAAREVHRPSDVPGQLAKAREAGRARLRIVREDLPQDPAADYRSEMDPPAPPASGSLESPGMQSASSESAGSESASSESGNSESDQ
ncbi:DUF3499 domain-containing protein [Actinobaculum massiliense]|uniref:DUF3499 domain-containing protein n=1 Tax=Actinobaculum massiliense TaxID=202789 RepID=UPI001EE2F2E5|nr:DUF3499 domain-containing protein [Actinobaculum massiliense]MDK8318952.1 DUF3499 domain-containing protein [Actinobaculum massiliense]MDK8567739.1 DUF3499 domain-containing protein [Actinobaculum massiliense]